MKGRDEQSNVPGKQSWKCRVESTVLGCTEVGGSNPFSPARIECGTVAQLDRVEAYEAFGRGFESLSSHQVLFVVCCLWYVAPLAPIGRAADL